MVGISIPSVFSFIAGGESATGDLGMLRMLRECHVAVPHEFQTQASCCSYRCSAATAALQLPLLCSYLQLAHGSAFESTRLSGAFRILRLFRRVESLNKIIVSLAKAVPGLMNAGLVMLLVMCICMRPGSHRREPLFRPCRISPSLMLPPA